MASRGIVPAISRATLGPRIIEVQSSESLWSRAIEEFDQLAHRLGYRHSRLVEWARSQAHPAGASKSPRIKVPGGIEQIAGDYLRHASHAVAKLGQRLDIWCTRLGLEGNTAPGLVGQSEETGSNQNNRKSELRVILEQLAAVAVCARSLEARLRKSKVTAEAAEAADQRATVDAGLPPTPPAPVSPLLANPLRSPGWATAAHARFVRDVLMFLASTRRSLRRWEEARGFRPLRTVSSGGSAGDGDGGGGTWLRGDTPSPHAYEPDSEVFDGAAFLLDEDEADLDDEDLSGWMADDEESLWESARAGSSGFAAVAATAATAGAAAGVAGVDDDDDGDGGDGEDSPVDCLSVMSHPCSNPGELAGTATRAPWLAVEDNSVEIEMTALPRAKDESE